MKLHNPYEPCVRALSDSLWWPASLRALVCAILVGTCNFISAQSIDTLITPLDFDNSAYGVMFDVSAERAVEIKKLFVNLGGSPNHQVRVYYKYGSHVGFEEVADAWAFAGATQNLASAGLDILTELPMPLSIDLPAFETLAIYIAVTSAVPGPIGAPSHVLYTVGEEVGGEVVSDSNITVHTGVAFGGFNSLPFQGTLVTPRDFNGAIGYASRALTMSCVSDTTLNCGQDLSPESLGTPVVSTLCGNGEWNLEYSDSIRVVEASNPQIVRTWTASDQCANEVICTQYITLNDLEKPEIIADGVFTVSCSYEDIESELLDWLIAQGTSDDCGELIVQLDAQQLNFQDGCADQLVSVSVMDLVGNFEVVDVMVRYIDTIAPELILEPIDIILSPTSTHIVDFQDLPEGPLGQLTTGGVEIDISAYSRIGEAEAWILNSAVQNQQDPDLGSPNRMYGGPGVASAENGWSPGNDRDLGNVLIVQTPGSEVPNDYFLSDRIEIDFGEPVLFHGLTALDIEQEQGGAFLHFYDDSNVLIDSVYAQGGMDNSITQIDVHIPGVSKVVFKFGGPLIASGAVADFCYSVLPEHPQNVYVDECSPSIVEEPTESLQSATDCEVVVQQLVKGTDACGNTSTTYMRNVFIDLDITAPFLEYVKPVYILCDSTWPAPFINPSTLPGTCDQDENISVDWEMDIPLVSDDDCGIVSMNRIYSISDTLGNERYVIQRAERVEAPLQLGVKAILRGAVGFGQSEMTPRMTEILPEAQPFTEKYDYEGDEELAQVTSSMIDWVFVELVDDEGMPQVSQAAILLDDGSVVDHLMSDTLNIVAPAGEYRIAFRHPRHLDVMTQEVLQVETSSLQSWDFTTQWEFPDSLGLPEYLYLLPSIDTVVALQQGDLNGDHKVTYYGFNTDRFAILTKVGITTPSNVVKGYHHEDANMDGFVRYNGPFSDRITVLMTVGFLTPNNVIYGQLY